MTTPAPKPSQKPFLTKSPPTTTKLPSKTPGKTNDRELYTGGKNDDCFKPSGHIDGQLKTPVKFKKVLKTELKKTKYDMNEVLTKSILFYEAQRSGVLPETQNVLWRGDSGLHDGCDVGHDLTGGWYDAGDHVKFGLPMAWSTTTLIWGMINYRDAYKNAWIWPKALGQVKWTLDYFVKCHTDKHTLYVQVGDGEADHGFWGRAEEMTMARPSFKIDPTNPGSEVAGETAAALAAGSILFRESNPELADLYLEHARDLFELANSYRASYNGAIPDIEDFYKSYGYQDEIAWAAAWIYRATKDPAWKSMAENLYTEFGIQYTGNEFNWDSKKPGVIAVMAEATGETVRKLTKIIYFIK